MPRLIINVNPFGACAKGEMYPHTMQMALVTGHVEALGKDGSTIASKNEITAQDAAAKTMEGMGQRRPNGVPLLWGEKAWR